MARVIEREVPVATSDGDVVATNPVARIIYVVVAAIEAILILRLLLRWLGANPLNGFVNFIYDLSAPLVAPFFGMFSSSVTEALEAARFEVPTIVAIVVYALIGWLLVSLFDAFSRRRVV